MNVNDTADKIMGDLWTVLGVGFRPRTYGNLTYLLLTVPLGTVYTMIIMTGVGMGISLIPFVIGVPILLVTLSAVHWLAVVERWLTNWLLDVNIPVRETDAPDWSLFGEKSRDETEPTVRTTLTFGLSWGELGVPLRELVFLGSKLLFGTVVWLVLSLSLLIGLLLLLSPLHYRNPNVGIHTASDVAFVPEFVYQHGPWVIDVVLPYVEIARGELISDFVDSPETLLLTVVVGFLITTLSLHLMNLIAWLYGTFAEWMLRSPEAANEAN